MTLAFCPVLDEIYRTRRAIGRTGRVYDQPGALSTVNNLMVIRALMLERQSAATLEVGLSFGGSALTFAATHRDLQHPPSRQHVAIDPVQSTTWDDCGRLALETAGLQDYVDVREDWSSTALPTLLAAPQRYDLIYVDGSHLFEDVFVDAYFGASLLSENGLILFDDSSDPHVGKVLAFIRSNWSGRLEEVDLSPYREDGGSLRYRVAKAWNRTQLRAFRKIAPGPRTWDAPFRDF